MLYAIFTLLSSAALATVIINPSVFASFISFLPAGGPLPAPIHEAAIVYGGYLSSVNAFLPVTDLLTILNYTYNIVMWLLVIYLAKRLLFTIIRVPMSNFRE